MESSKIILVTRPRHDSTVEYLSYWAQEIIGCAGKKGMKVIDCKGPKANKKEVCSHLVKQNPRFVLFNGHGTQSSIHGHNDEMLINRSNADLCKSQIVHAISCKAAAQLGKDICSNSNGAFIGYEQDYWFIKDAQRECTPPKDRFAEPFKEASNIVSVSLIKGNSAFEAFEKSQQKYATLIKEYATSEAAPENRDIRFWLFWDKYFQRIIGNGKAAI